MEVPPRIALGFPQPVWPSSKPGLVSRLAANPVLSPAQSNRNVTMLKVCIRNLQWGWELTVLTLFFIGLGYGLN
jgi:hypothetical protein